MGVVDVQRDMQQRTMTIVSRFDAPVARVWEMWSDPRRLERWWGPPGFPATVTEHDITLGGAVAYFMTGPQGERHHGWWQITEVDAPHMLAFEDGFANADGSRNDDLPGMTISVLLAGDDGGGTTMSITTAFASEEAMATILAMGAEEGMTLAIGQIDVILGES